MASNILNIEGNNYFVHYFVADTHGNIILHHSENQKCRVIIRLFDECGVPVKTSYLGENMDYDYAHSIAKSLELALKLS